MNNDKTDKAVSYSHRLFNVRPRSERELRERLSKKGFAGQTVNEAVSLLKEKKLLDDFKFAKLWVESRMHINPKGDMLLKKELKDKGVSASIVEEVLSEKTEKEDVVARELVKQNLARLKNLPKRTAKKKLFTFLARRGFDFDVIEDVLREAFDGIGE